MLYTCTPTHTLTAVIPTHTVGAIVKQTISTAGKLQVVNVFCNFITYILDCSFDITYYPDAASCYMYQDYYTYNYIKNTEACYDGFVNYLYDSNTNT